MSCYVSISMNYIHFVCLKVGDALQIVMFYHVLLQTMMNPPLSMAIVVVSQSGPIIITFVYDALQAGQLCSQTCLKHFETEKTARDVFVFLNMWSAWMLIPAGFTTSEPHQGDLHFRLAWLGLSQRTFPQLECEELMGHDGTVLALFGEFMLRSTLW